MDEQEFRDRVVLITGGARNIGRTLALRFSAAGAVVVINTRSSKQELDETVQQVRATGGEAMGCLGDVCDAGFVADMTARVAARYGRLDMLVNNAVSHAFKPFLELSAEEWHQTLTVTLDGAFHCTRACVPHMMKSGGGSIVNMGGAFGHLPGPGRAATAAAKAGLAGLTRALAVEFAGSNINVNYVAPGPVNTHRHTPLAFDMSRIPMGRFAETSEVAAMVMLLCSRQGRYITGQTLHVNGGFYMNN